MTAAIDGPRLEPASGGPARQLVVLCHGYGADGNDLIALGQQWQVLLPDACFVSPHGPEPCGMAPMGRQWFPLMQLTPDEYWQGVRAAAPVLAGFIDAELERLGLDAGKLALVGFSQGTMMSLHVGLRRAVAPAAILGYSGALAGPEHLAGEIRARPPVLLVHGSHDELIPVAALHAAAEALAAAGVPVQWHVSRGLGHGIDGVGLEMGGAFLKAAFEGTLGKIPRSPLS